MDYKRIQVELLTALRGKRSQRQVSQSLGFSSNKLAQWESKKGNISWQDFVKFCKTVRAPLGESLRLAYGYNSDPTDLKSLIQHFAFKSNPTIWQQEINVSRQTVQRWIKGTYLPSLHQILNIFSLGSTEFLFFFEKMGIVEKMPSLQEAWKKTIVERELHYNFPWVSAVLSAIDSEQYKKRTKHSDEFLAEFARLPVKKIRATLKVLYDSGAITKEKDLYRSTLKMISLPSTEGARAILKFWNRRSGDFIQKNYRSQRSVSSCQIFNFDATQFKKLQDCCRRFYNEVATIAEAHPTANSAYVLALNLLNFEDLPIDDLSES